MTQMRALGAAFVTFGLLCAGFVVLQHVNPHYEVLDASSSSARAVLTSASSSTSSSTGASASSGAKASDHGDAFVGIDTVVAEGQFCSDSRPLNAIASTRGFGTRVMCHNACLSWRNELCHYYTYTKENSGTCLLHSKCTKKSPIASSSFCLKCRGDTNIYKLFGGCVEIESMQHRHYSWAPSSGYIVNNQAAVVAKNVSRAGLFRVFSPGPAGRGSVGFQSCYKPDHWYRHENFVLRLAHEESNDRFKADASFYEHKDKFFPGTYSYSSFNYPSRWIRTDHFILQVLGGYDEKFKKSASFFKLPVNDSLVARPDGVFRVVTKTDKIMLGIQGACTDDSTWNNNKCAIVKQKISKNPLAKVAYCRDGSWEIFYCKKTCDTCNAKRPVCPDHAASKQPNAKGDCSCPANTPLCSKGGVTYKDASLEGHLSGCVGFGTPYFSSACTTCKCENDAGQTPATIVAAERPVRKEVEKIVEQVEAKKAESAPEKGKEASTTDQILKKLGDGESKKEIVKELKEEEEEEDGEKSKAKAIEKEVKKDKEEVKKKDEKEEEDEVEEKERERKKLEQEKNRGPKETEAPTAMPSRVPTLTPSLRPTIGPTLTPTRLPGVHTFKSATPNQFLRMRVKITLL
jgi:hypothetical protein